MTITNERTRERADEPGIAPTWERSPDAPESPSQRKRPGFLSRARRKLSRWGNEARSIYEERLKRPELRAWPVAVNLNHTTICNLRCVMCEQALEDVPQKVMSRPVYHRIRDELFEHASEVSLTVMGDPFCVPKPFFNELLDDIESHDLRLEITTNATLFGNDEELERLTRLTNKMVISIDGATKETFERIRTPAKWERTVGNIERFVRVRRSLPLHKRPLVYFNYVLMRSNLDEFPLLIEHAKRWDAYSVMGSPMVTVHPSLAEEAIREDDPHVQAVLAQARDAAYRHGMGLSIPGFDFSSHPAEGRWTRFPMSSHLKAWAIPVRPVFSQGFNYLAQKLSHKVMVAERECGFLWNKAYLQIDGGVSTCCHPDYIVTGDVQESSFREIWNGKRYRALRQTLNTDHPADPCRDCHLLRR